jgi:hypothetical protein
MSVEPPVPATIPSRPDGPGGGIRLTLIAAMVVLGGACGHAIPGFAGLLVATGGPLQVTDSTGTLMPFDGPGEPVVMVGASEGRVVAATNDGRLLASVTTTGSGQPWTLLPVPFDLAAGSPLVALSPHGGELAIAVGELQDERFDLVVVDVGTAASRSIPVDRGLNGPPSWIGPTSVAIDVIRPSGESGLASIDVASGAVADLPGDSRLATSTLDGRTVAIDAPSGAVLVGAAALWRAGTTAGMTSLPAIAGTGVDGLALSPDGRRLAIVRRRDAGGTSIDLYAVIEGAWERARSLVISGDPAVSIAWLR